MRFGGRFGATVVPGRAGTAAVAIALLAVLAGCGDGGEPAGSGPAGGGGSSAGGGGDSADRPEIPRFASDFERTCTDGLGFGGLPAFSRTAKQPQPAVLLTKTTDLWIQQSSLDDDFPRGWILGPSGNLAKAVLVVCQERTNATPAGRTCQMKDQKTGQPFQLTLYNTRYRLRVLEARTGTVLYDRPGQARSTECPSFTFVGSDEDRTKYYTDPRPRDYRAVLKRYITPGAR